MRNYLLAAAAAVALATPAMARDGSPYVGIEGGLMIPEDLNVDVTVIQGATRTRFNNAYSVDFDPGLDADIIAGYDFGAFRIEGELGYKRLRLDDVNLGSGLAGELGVAPGDFDDVSGNGRVFSLMANGLLDFGSDDGWAGYVGAGIGRASVRFAGDSDSAMALQGIAGVRKAITPNIDLGLKYRYFRTAKLNFDDRFTDGTTTVGVDQKAKLRTHSLLASVIYNFAAPAPVVVEPVVVPPAPPAPAPATQTCYDGSVILATDVCPQPPAPTPMPERG